MLVVWKLVGVFTIIPSVLQKYLEHSKHQYPGEACLCRIQEHACGIFYFPCIQKEMSDKTAAVCPACLLYLNVCVQCPDRQQGCLALCSLQLQMESAESHLSLMHKSAAPFKNKINKYCLQYMHLDTIKWLHIYLEYALL